MSENPKKYTIDNAKNDIQNLQDQNSYDFQEIKRLDRLIKEYNKKVLQAINMNNQINKKIQDDYENFKKSIIDDNLDFGTGSGGGSGLTATQLSNIAKIPTIQSTVDALPNNYASKDHNHIEYASSSHRHDASEIDNLPSGGGVSQDDINTAVNNYLTEHPVSSGATTEQAAQIQANKTAIGDINSGLIKKVNDIEARLGEEDISNLEDLRTDRVLIWHDEFDKPELDETKWGHLVGGYKADKHRYYMYEDVSKNVYCNDSILHITNLKDHPTSSIDFSGAFIHTHGKFEFKYGLVEAKIKFPNAPAYHATLWTMSTNYIPTDMLIYSGIKSNTHGSSKGENDIAECDQKNVSCTLHSTAKDSFGSKPIGIGTEWHIYSCEWTETEMKYYLDGNLINTINVSPANNKDGSTNPFNKPHFLMLNMNPYMDSVSDQTKEFLDWEIDWVRVYAPVSVPNKKETSMVLNIKDTTINKTDSSYKALKAIFTPDVCNQTIKWESYNKNVVIVKGGDVFPVGVGTTYVKATTKNGLVDFCKIVVKGDSNPGGGSSSAGDGTFEAGYVSNNGTIVKDPKSDSSNASSTYYTEVLPNTTYTLYIDSSIPHDAAKIAEYDENKTFISRVLTDTITTSSNAKYVRFTIGYEDGIDATKLNSSLVYIVQQN